VPKLRRKKVDGQKLARSYLETRAKHPELFRDRRDWAAELAHAVFVGNLDEIYQSLTESAKKGDPKTFTALANRAYGMPDQKVNVEQEKPFKLVIEYIGQEPRRLQELQAEVIQENRQLASGSENQPTAQASDALGAVGRRADE